MLALRKAFVHARSSCAVLTPVYYRIWPDKIATHTGELTAMVRLSKCLTRTTRNIGAAILLTTLAFSANAIEVGQRAPDFVLVGSDGRKHRLRDYRGEAVVLAWFPKAFTGG